MGMETHYKIDNVYNFITELKYLTENINNHYNHLTVKQDNFNEKLKDSRINILSKNIDKIIKQKFETCLSLINSTLYSLNNITADEMDLINNDEELNRIKSVNFIEIISSIDSKTALAIDKINEILSESENELQILRESQLSKLLK